MLQKPDGAGIKSPSATLSFQALQGLLNRLFRQIKGTPVNAEEVRAPNGFRERAAPHRNSFRRVYPESQAMSAGEPPWIPRIILASSFGPHKPNLERQTPLPPDL